MERRSFIKGIAAAASLTGISNQFAHAMLKNGHRTGFPPVRRITNGPKYHWFGYYDKLQFDAANKLVLGMEVDFQHRTPNVADRIKIGIIDLAHGDKWEEIGKSDAWGWQQGCMLQWVPNRPNTVIWNDREGDHFIANMLDVSTGKRKILDKPIYAISPDGKWAVGLDFGRLQDLRPGYGYKGVPDPYAHIKAPEKTGIYRIDLDTGVSTFLIPYARCAAIPHKGADVSGKWHWYNHLLISPDGERIEFLNRWRESKDIANQGSGFVTRMFTADKNGQDLYVIDPSGYTSHFVWKDSQHICAWTRPDGHPDGFYELEDKTGNFKRVGEGVMVVNGHNTYVPGTKTDWILNDTYPQGEDRIQTPYLYQVSTNKRVDIGAFHSGVQYKGEWRCDLHPRCSQDGKSVVVDSVHEGMGRQMYLIDIGDIVG